MKKITYVLLTIFIMLLSVSPVLAKSPLKVKVVTGQVSSINGDGTFTVLTAASESFVVIAPGDFDMSTLQVGAEVVIKGTLQDDGSLIADWVKVTGKPETVGSSEQGQDPPENASSGLTGLQNNPYCSAEKEEPHPMAAYLAEKYSVSTEWVMGYFCSGVNMGAIFLALKTSELQGVSADDILAQYSAGQNWGAIWQGLNLIGNERDLKTPPGWLKKGGPKK